MLKHCTAAPIVKKGRKLYLHTLYIYIYVCMCVRAHGTACWTGRTDHSSSTMHLKQFLDLHPCPITDSYLDVNSSDIAKQLHTTVFQGCNIASTVGILCTRTHTHHHRHPLLPFQFFHMVILPMERHSYTACH